MELILTFLKRLRSDILKKHEEAEKLILEEVKRDKEPLFDDFEETIPAVEQLDSLLNN
jgi:hypothetical protein